MTIYIKKMYHWGMIERKFYRSVWQNLSRYKNMIFISGPRQAGKTTFVKRISKGFSNTIYFNWDIIEDKRKIIDDPYFFRKINRIDDSIPFVILNEIHKYSRWKNYLKGVYDKYYDEYMFVITGSGRLDTYQKGGDSLAGRYILFYLWPFTIGELSNNKYKNYIFVPERDKKNSDIWNDLKNYSGFPEPFLKKDKNFYNIWSNTYFQQIIREDIRNVSDIRNIDLLEILFSLIPSRVGSNLSISNISKLLQVSFETIKTWLLYLERFFLVFKINSWHKGISRSILKEKKYYLLNYSVIEDPGKRFENMVALELYRFISTKNALGEGKFSLHYLLNKQKEEVDFLVANNNKPVFIVETKYNDDNVSKNLVKFQKLLNIPAIQLVEKKDICRKFDGILVCTAYDWLSYL